MDHRYFLVFLIFFFWDLFFLRPLSGCAGSLGGRAGSERNTDLQRRQPLWRWRAGGLLAALLLDAFPHPRVVLPVRPSRVPQAWLHRHSGGEQSPLSTLPLSSAGRRAAFGARILVAHTAVGFNHTFPLFHTSRTIIRNFITKHDSYCNKCVQRLDSIAYQNMFYLPQYVCDDLTGLVRPFMFAVHEKGSLFI